MSMTGQEDPTGGDALYHGGVRRVSDANADTSPLRSKRFRAEREAGWRRLEGIVNRIDRHGRQSLSPDELMALPHLYRSTLSSLAIARAYVLDSTLVAYLDALATRAHLAMFANTTPVRRLIADLAQRDVPRAIRTLAGPIALSALVLLLGIVVGRLIIIERPDLFETLVSPGIAQGRTPFASPEALYATIYGGEVRLDELQTFALFLIQNNVLVALACVGLGIALGVPTALLLFYNGILIGALIGTFALAGLETDFIAWLSVHGTTELLAIILAGGGGFAIAHSFMFPRPRQSRIAAAAAVGRDVGRVALAAVVLLLIAGFLEGFARQLINDPVGRFAVGLSFAAIWAAYFGLAGRPVSTDRRRPPA